MIRSLYWGPAGERLSHALRSEGEVECASDWRSWKQRGGAIWIDILHPSREQLGHLAEVFDLHQVALEMIMAQRSRPKLTTFDHFLVLRMYGPKDLPIVHTRQAPLDTVEELSIVVGDRFAITIHNDLLPALETIWKDHQRDTQPPNDVSELVHEVMDNVVDRFFPTLDEMVDRVEEIQEVAFMGSAGGSVDRAKVQELFNLKRQLNNLHRILEPQRSAIAILAREELPFFRTDSAAFQDIYDHAGRQSDVISVYVDLLLSARESYMVRMSNVLATSAKTLLTLTLFFAIPTFVFTTYGMNFDHMPELRLPFGHGFPLLVVLLADTALFTYFNRKLRLFG